MPEPEPNPDKIEERKFQIELLKVQQGIDISGSIIGVIASVFVAIIATSLTLVVALPSSLISITVYVIGYEIAVAVFTLLVSWWIIVIFRDRKIKKIKKQFHIPLE